MGAKAKRVVVLANGEFPCKNGAAWLRLLAADVVVACDGAATTLYRRLGRAADYVVGDFDSLRHLPKGAEKSKYVRIDDQSTNDLTKALTFCCAHGWHHPLVVGAAGKREDHLIGNVFRAMEAGAEVLTEEGRFLPARKFAGAWRLSMATRRGQALSVFCTDPKVEMRSTGLKWPLAGVRIGTLYAATLNRALSAKSTIVANRPFFAFLAREKEGRR